MEKRIQYDQITSLDPDWVRDQIANFMAEDISEGDVTTEATVTASTSVIAKMNAAEDFVFCGSSIVPFCFPDSCQVT